MFYCHGKKNKIYNQLVIAFTALLVQSANTFIVPILM